MTRVALAAGWSLPSVEGAAEWLSNYPAVLVLLLITVTGEVVVLGAVIVAVQGSWSLVEVVAWCFLGTVASDLAWFRLAGAADRRWSRHLEGSERSQAVMGWLRERTGQRPWLALVVVKFLYGSRFLMIVYVATRRISPRRFVVYDGLGTAAWLAVLVPLGWAIARGVVGSGVSARLDVLVVVLVAVLLGLRGVSGWITARLRRRSLPS